MPRASRRGAESDCGGGRTAAAAGRDHRRAVVHHGAAAPDRVDFATGGSRGHAFKRRNPSRVEEEPSGFCRRAWHSAGTGVAQFLKKSHQDFAAELGTVRELVSRNLSWLQAEGYLEVEGRKLVIKDFAGMKRELSSLE
ncbi:MAG: hypothetical protein DMG39_15600 [Acidobacteria bacterium]|nr:MAG: hypothetical protein DMG39_15600 [Acidobacteriota bacterium]